MAIVLKPMRGDYHETTTNDKNLFRFGRVMVLARPSWGSSASSGRKNGKAPRDDKNRISIRRQSRLFSIASTSGWYLSQRHLPYNRQYPNPTNKPTTVAAKVALATGFGSEPGPFDVTPFKKVDLQPDGATELSCFDVAGFFCPIDIDGGVVCVDFAFLEGFVVIKSPVPLDVVSVYTARHTEGEVETMDVEAIEPQRIRETIKLMPTVAGSEIKKRIEYPPKGSPAYGGKEYPK
jgi:hypothetical protein